MIELLIEEKAQKYDDALKRAKKLYEQGTITESLKHIFPELAESEDERIRKALLEMVHDTTGDSLWVDYNIHKEDALAWLEKQGEQKPAEWSEIDKANLEDSIYFVKEFRRSNLCDNESRLQNSRTCIEWLVSLKDRVQPQPKQEWSEEDKKMFVNIKACLRNANKDYSREVDWLKSIKPQPKNEWSEEDERCLTNAIDACKQMSDEDYDYSQSYIDAVNFLKSLKERYTWKPSSEQMEAFEHFVRIIGESGYDNNTKLLNSLLSDLKKLRVK